MVVAQCDPLWPHRQTLRPLRAAAGQHPNQCVPSRRGSGPECAQLSSSMAVAPSASSCAELARSFPIPRRPQPVAPLGWIMFAAARDNTGARRRVSMLVGQCVGDLPAAFAAGLLRQPREAARRASRFRMNRSLLDGMECQATAVGPSTWQATLPRSCRKMLGLAALGGSPMTWRF